jgi:hypothetical protein
VSASRRPSRRRCLCRTGIPRSRSPRPGRSQPFPRNRIWVAWPGRSGHRWLGGRRLFRGQRWRWLLRRRRWRYCSRRRRRVFVRGADGHRRLDAGGCPFGQRARRHHSVMRFASPRDAAPADQLDTGTREVHPRPFGRERRSVVLRSGRRTFTMEAPGHARSGSASLWLPEARYAVRLEREVHSRVATPGRTWAPGSAVLRSTHGVETCFEASGLESVCRRRPQ